MVYEGVLEGNYVTLRACTEDDAEFTLAIRQDPEMTKYLPPLSSTVNQQREWIRSQREKEGDYFFVVWSKATNERIGTIGIYDVHDGEGEGGRLALYGEVYEKIEAGILMFEYIFNNLNLFKTTGWVYCNNKKAIRWNKGFGAVFDKSIKHLDGKEVVYFENTKEDCLKACSKLKREIARFCVEQNS